jgi:hypothetical protein
LIHRKVDPFRESHEHQATLGRCKPGIQFVGPTSSGTPSPTGHRSHPSGWL